MVFSTLLFLFRFLPVALLLYYIVPAKYRNAVLFVVSLVFYSWGEVRYFPIMIFSTILDYTCGMSIKRWRDNKIICRIALLVSVVVNLGMLFFFKYTDFFITNINALLGTSIPLLKLTLPLGISFYTFQTMSYTIDVYRGNAEPEKNIINFGAYVTMFPQLIAGPIVRYTDVAERLNIMKGRITADRLDEGITEFIFGLVKKVIIANGVGALWTELTGTIGLENASTGLAWLGIIAYTMQIYFDFSGYSLMAIGLGKMLGFDFPANFDHPYISKSITEFWRRWHITLGSWFREYVYIPLGGNRCGKARQIFNIAVVWFLTGFWHGADWNFILWGVFYFVLLMIEKLWLLKPLKKVPALAHIYTMFFVIIGWAIFDITDLGQLGAFLTRLFVPTGGVDAAYYLRNYAVILLLAIVSCTPLPRKLFDKFKHITWARGLCLAAALFVVIAYLSNATYNPFLYFRF